MLVVGAGAVGQVIGLAVQQSGARLTFFVREKYRSEVSEGFDLYPLNRRRSSAPVRLQGFETASRPEEVAKHRFDQVYLTVPSPAVRGPWLPELVSRLGDATVVALQPSPDDRLVVLASGVPEGRLVSGMISFVSYAAPLPEEPPLPRPGMAFWFPPLSPSRFSGPPEAAAAVVETLARGGLPAKLHPHVPSAVAFPTAMLMAYLTALEAAGWSLRRFAREGLLALGAEGAGEAVAIIARSEGRPPWAAKLLARPWLLRLGLWIAGRLVPFPFERYLEKHFRKVGGQTALLLSNLIAQGKRGELPVGALERLEAKRTSSAQQGW